MADDVPSSEEVKLEEVKAEDVSKDSIKPRAARTTAIKVTAGLLAKVASGLCGADLKITGIMPHDSLLQLCDALVANVVTRRLDLEGCGVGDRGCIMIRDLLLKNRTIETLDLKLNQISDAGVKLLADAMQKSASIQMLFLNDNDVTDLGVQHLLAALQNGCGCFVSLRGCCRVSPAMLQELEDFVEGRTVQSKPSIPEKEKELKEKKVRETDAEKCDKLKNLQSEQLKAVTPKVAAPVSPKRVAISVPKFSDFQVICGVDMLSHLKANCSQSYRYKMTLKFSKFLQRQSPLKRLKDVLLRCPLVPVWLNQSLKSSLPLQLRFLMKMIIHSIPGSLSVQTQETLLSRRRLFECMNL